MTNSIKRVLIAIAVVVIITLAGCSDGNDKYKSGRFVKIEKQLNYESTIFVYVDTKTGVEYVRFGSSSPVMLHDADGTPYVSAEYGGK